MRWLLLLCSGFLLAAGLRADDVTVRPHLAGWGTTTPAGRGGQVITVTCLKSDGPGTLRAALATAGPRTVVFAIGGVIDLGQKPVRIDHGRVTVAGQTAPDPGIILVGAGLHIEASDVLVQHLTIRIGDRGPKGYDADGLAIYSGKGARRIVIDHCSIAWAIDECLDIYRTVPDPDGTADITVADCIIAHGLSASKHSKGEHSKGVLLGAPKRVLLLRNLIAHHNERAPMIGQDTSLAMCNNLVWNPGWAAVTLCRDPTPQPPQLALRGNVCVLGPDSRKHLGWISGKDVEGKGRPVTVFSEDDLVLTAAGKPAPWLVQREDAHLSAKLVQRLSRAPLWPDGLKPMPSAQVVEHVLANAGSRPARRHHLDQLLIAGLRDHSGRIIDTPEQAGGMPTDAAVARALPALPSTKNDADGNRRSDLEEWLEQQAQAVEPAQPR